MPFLYGQDIGMPHFHDVDGLPYWRSMKRAGSLASVLAIRILTLIHAAQHH
jgi:hypothetical protein